MINSDSTLKREWLEQHTFRKLSGCRSVISFVSPTFFFFFYKAIISLIMCMLHQYFKVRRPYSYHPPIVSFWHDVQLDSYQNKGSSECENWTKQQDLSLIYLVSTSRTSAASWSLRCPFSPWPPPPGSSEMVRRSFLECLLGWYLWDHLWRQK